MSYELLFQRAVQLHEAGQLNEAEQIYRRILETAPQQPEVLNLLGLVAKAKGVQLAACFIRRLGRPLPVRLFITILPFRSSWTTSR